VYFFYVRQLLSIILDDLFFVLVGKFLLSMIAHILWSLNTEQILHWDFCIYYAFEFSWYAYEIKTDVTFFLGRTLKQRELYQVAYSHIKVSQNSNLRC
jgi:hypothetical protein